MRTFKCVKTIPADRTLVIEVPENMPTGEAEILVSLCDEQGGGERALLAYLDDLAVQPRSACSKAAIDRELREERNSWE